MVYYGNQGGQLEYDFVVTPGADPDVINLDIGAEGLPVVPLRIAEGDLVVKIGGGEVHFHRPVIYQVSAGSDRQLVEGHYVLDRQGHVRFQVAPYDHSRALYIDPVLSYSTYLGGGAQDEATSIAVDSSGNMYIAGWTYSSDFPVENGFQGNAQGFLNAFVTKLSPDGSSLVYSTYLGGSAGYGGYYSETSAAGIALDSSGSAYVTGYTTATNFPTQNPFQGTLQGSESAFVTKLSADGSSLLYSTYLGGPDTVTGTGEGPSPASNQAVAIAVDSGGSAYVTGYTDSTDFPTQNPFQSSCVIGLYGNCASPGFVTKLAPNGSSLVYSTYLQGSDPACGSACDGYITSVSPNAIAVDASGSAYLTGQTASPIFPVTQNAFQQSCVLKYLEASPYTFCYGYAFVSKMSTDGSSLIYSTYLGGGSGDTGAAAMALDSNGQAYIAGTTSSAEFPLQNAFQSAYVGSSAFVTEFTADLSALVYSTYLGGSSTGYGGPSTVAGGIALDSAGDAYVVGSTNTTDFPTANAIQPTCGLCDGTSNAFVTKFNAGGATLAYSTFLGGSGSDGASAIALDSTGNAYVAGGTASSNFPTVNPLQATYAGGYGDAFVAKISNASPAFSFSPGSLNFGLQPLGAASTSQTETLTNAGTVGLAVSAATLGGTNSGDFSKIADTCTGATIAPNGTCSVGVIFTPSIMGAESGTITITDYASTSPQTLSMAGTGTAPIAAVTTIGLTFSSQAVGTQSPSQSFALNNTGNSALTVASIAITGANPGDFGETNTCGLSVPAGGSCTFMVWFAPTGAGSRGAALTITDNSGNVQGSQQAVSLSGNGTAPTVSYAPASLAFGDEVIGATSGAESVTLSNSGTAALTIASIGVVGADPTDFAFTTTCTSTLAVNAGCTISVTFAPTAAGNRTASLSITDNANGSPQTISLSGTAISPGLGASSLLVGSAGGATSVILTYGGPWTATSNSSFLHVAAGSTSGTANAVVAFNCDTFTGTTGTRTGTLTIAGYTFTVKQAGTSYIGPGPVSTLVSSGLTSPLGVAVDGSGNVYVANSGNSAIDEWSATTQQSTTLVSSGLNSPSGVAVDGSGNVYIADTLNNAVKEWSQATQQVTTLVPAGLNEPLGVAVDGSGNVYIADTYNDAIKEWNPVTQQVTTLVSTGLNSPSGVAVDGSGNVYIADTGNFEIKEWTPASQQVAVLVPASAGLNFPYGVGVDGSGNVYIADSFNFAIREWSPATQQLTTLLAAGAGGPYFGVAAGKSGDVYLTDFTNDTTREIPYAFVGPASLSEPATAGSGSLLPVLPATASLTGIFAPTSDQSWLTIGTIAKGVVNFSFNANTSAARTAHISILGQQITVTQNGLLPQTITFSPLQNQPYGTSPFTASATASSGLPVSFSSQTSKVCKVYGDTVTLVAVGTCTVQATQAGNSTYAPAPPVDQSFQVTKESQTITFSPLSNEPYGTPPFTVSATASSGLTVSFNSQTTKVCTVSGATVTIVAAGTCTIQATQAGNSDYSAAPPVDQSFQVTKASQTITFGTLSNETLGSPPFGVSATASSGLAVSFGSQTTKVCTVSGNTVTLVAVGTCTVQATQKGNTDYAPAAPVNQSFKVTQ